MLRDDLPMLDGSATMREAIMMIAKRRGIAVIVDGTRHVDGVLTAGDLSRLVERERDVMPIPVRSVMTRTPKIAHAGELASAVAYRLEQHGLMVMPVVNEADELVGVVHLHDLFAPACYETRTLRARWTRRGVAAAACRDSKLPPVVSPTADRQRRPDADRRDRTS